MEWLNQTEGFYPNDLEFFQFNSPQNPSFSLETLTLWKDRSGGLEHQHEAHGSEEKFRSWLKKVCSSSDEPRQPSILLVMHPRLNGCHPVNGAETGAMTLPYGKETFLQAAKQMFQHRSLSNLIKGKSTAAFRSKSVNWKDNQSWGPSIVYNCKSDTESPTDSNDVVLSVTCFRKIQKTFAVMYGCTQSTRRLAKVYMKYVQMLGRGWHPMLLPMFFAEVERKRLFNLLDNEKAKLRQRILNMENKLKGELSKGKKDEDMDSTVTLRDCESTKVWMAVSSLKDGLKSFTVQLATMNEHLKILSATPDNYPQERDIGEMIETRLKEMILECESKIRSTEGILGGMALANQMEWNYYTRRDTKLNIIIASASKRDSSQMKRISLVGMIFLPGTFLATLFSMGFFDWTLSQSSHMISPWIALYFVLTAILTSLAIWQWKKWTDDEDKKATLAIEKEISDDSTLPV